MKINIYIKSLCATWAGCNVLMPQIQYLTGLALSRPNRKLDSL